MPSCHSVSYAKKKLLQISKANYNDRVQQMNGFYFIVDDLKDFLEIEATSAQMMPAVI